MRATLSTPPPSRRRRRAFDWSTAVIAILAVTAAVTVYLRDGRQHFLDVLVSDVSLFGEMLPQHKISRIYEEFYLDPPEAVITVGTSNMFPYVIEPVVVAARAGRLTIEVNPEATSISDIVDHHLQSSAGEALPAIAANVASPSSAM